MSVVNTSALKIGEKNFPSGHAHFIPHLLLNYKLTDKWNVGGGYAFGRHDIFGLRENENRIVLQTVYNYKIGKLTTNNRGRFEWRSPLNLQTNVRSDASIFRYQLGLNYLLYDTKKYKRGFYALASNEVFLYLKGVTNGPVSSKKWTFIIRKLVEYRFGLYDRQKSNRSWIWFSIVGQKQKTRYTFLEFVATIIHDYY